MQPRLRTFHQTTLHLYSKYHCHSQSLRATEVALNEDEDTALIYFNLDSLASSSTARSSAPI